MLIYRAIRVGLQLCAGYFLLQRVSEKYGFEDEKTRVQAYLL